MISKATFSCSAIALTFLLPCASAGDLDLPDDWREVQLESNWCGAKCLWVIAAGMGKPLSLEEIKSFCPAGKERDGMLSLDDLRQGAEKCGLSAMVVRCKYEWLIRKGSPAITLHRLRRLNRDDANAFANHFVVCLGADGGSVRVIDPFSPGKATLVRREVFERTWTGDALVLAESPDDLPSLRGWRLATVLTALLLVGLGALLASKVKRHGPIAAACVLSAFAFTGCSRGQPGLQFDHLHHDFGVLWQDQFTERVKRHAFPFVNQSDSPVRITKVQGDCGCLSVHYPKEPIPPGGPYWHRVGGKVIIDATKPPLCAGEEARRSYERLKPMGWQSVRLEDFLPK